VALKKMNNCLFYGRKGKANVLRWLAGAHKLAFRAPPQYLAAAAAAAVGIYNT